LLPTSPIDIGALLEKPTRRVLITGITGQDGLYLTSYLLFECRDYNYEIHGIVRKNSANLPWLYQMEEVLSKNKLTSIRSITLHTGDLTDALFMS
jgi:GDP-D-mannose dehydratase